MPNFEEAWMAVAGHRNGEPVSPSLRTRLQEVYVLSLSHPFDPAALKRSLEDLFEYLSGEGRTNANC